MPYRPLCFGLLLAAQALTGTVFSQDSTEARMLRHAKEVELEKARRTPQENKLGGGLLGILRKAEAAETSASKARQLADYLSRIELFEFDQLGRILVQIEFDSLADTTTIVQKIRSLNGLVVRVGRTVPGIHCKIGPKQMRALIQLREVKFVKPMDPISFNSETR